MPGGSPVPVRAVIVGWGEKLPAIHQSRAERGDFLRRQREIRGHGRVRDDEHDRPRAVGLDLAAELPSSARVSSVPAGVASSKCFRPCFFSIEFWTSSESRLRMRFQACECSKSQRTGARV